MSVARAAGDWARVRRGGRGVELLEAAFEHHVYDRHSHDTLAVGITLSGVQRFWCRGSAHDSRPGDVIVLDPGEVHDGRSGAHGGYAYRMLYIDAGTAKDIIADASGRPPRDLISDSPLVRDPLLAREINAAWTARALTLMDADEEVVAAEFKINLLRPAVGPRIVAEAQVVRAGRTLVVSEVTVSAVVDGQSVRVAMMLQTNCRVKMSGEIPLGR